MNSRSALEFLRRSGLKEVTIRHNPRLDVQALLVHTLPLSPPKPSLPVLQDLEGHPAPDRGAIKRWPLPQR